MNTTEPAAATTPLLRLPAVKARTGLGRSTIYRLMSQGEFPKCAKLTTRAVGWRASDIDAWIASRPLQP